MRLHPEFVGIDVSKATLDLFDTALGRAERIANDALAIEAKVAIWRSQGHFVLFEATGRYDAVLRAELQAQGVPFARVNPSQARDFARATGHLAKTDAVDARMLATMARRLQPAAQEPVRPERQRLGALHRRRDQLVAMRAQERARATEAHSAEESQWVLRHIEWLSAEIKAIERQIRQQIAKAAQLAEHCRLLRSVPGVGPVTATTLLALLPELGHRSPKTIAALVGLAPLNRDSGQFRGTRHIAGGRKRVRDALYMAALTARRRCPRFRATYETMITAGKPPKVALVAIARKLLLALNAMARDHVAFA